MSVVSTIDKNKIRQSFASAANTYDELAALQRKVGLKLLQQLSEQSQCQQVVDLGCGTGFLTQQLVERDYIKQIVAVDIALAMLKRTQVKLETANNVHYLCADAEYLPLMDHSIEMIISNLALQWCQNLTTVFKGFNQALKKEGKILFSTFGPNTLQELKKAWAAVDDYTHVNEFYSAGEIEGFLRQSGFKDIKIVTQSYYSYYSSVIELMRELKGIGAHNVLSHRNRQTTRKTDMQAMISGYEKNREKNGIPATYEILFVSASVIKE